MVRKWKEEYAPRVLVINGKVVSANENEIDTSFPPSKYIKSGERWCPYHNPESFGKIVHLSIIKELKCYSWIYENIIKYLNNSPFYDTSLNY